MQPQTFVFFGIVGSGKGTQVKLLMDFLKQKDGKECVYVGTGDIFRKMKEVQDILASGQLVSDEKTNELVAEAVKSNLSPDRHVIFDGYPRTVIQSKFFEEIIKSNKRENVKIIYIELSKEEAMKRNLLRGRHDDTKEGLAKRFEEYEQKVIPSMDYFRNKNGYTIYTINGKQSVEAVRTDIINALGY